MRPMRLGIVAGIVLGFTATSSLGHAQALPPKVAAVQKYILEEDYPEVFAGKSYRVKIEDVLTSDLDGDGREEVIVQFTPHYRQSPTIVIYRVSPDLQVSRVREGLAPGPLRPLTDEFLDSHALGEAVDLDIGSDQSDPKKRHSFAVSMLDQKASVVEYRNFVHVDVREGAGDYIDMTELPSLPTSKKCDDFQFSTVRQIGAGSVPQLGQGNMLAAWAEGQVYLYKIKAIPASGFLEKKMWTIAVTADFRGFGPSADGALTYQTASGGEAAFVVQCDGMRCKQLVQ